MKKLQKCGMEQHAFAGFSGSIESISDNGTAQAQRMGGMQPELMGTTGQGDKLYPGCAVAHRQSTPEGDPRLAPDRIIDLVRPVVRVKTKGKFDPSLLLPDHPAKYGQVFFPHPAFGKLSGKQTVGLHGTGQHHEAGGVHVEPVD